jgi:phosphopantothenoylcysteine decarboxylase / phosphopantothenate---cysteine ligase
MGPMGPIRILKTTRSTANTENRKPKTMSRILITSGPTRQYLDPVRYLTNASSGRMGAALAAAALDFGHEVVVVTGPVEVTYPRQLELIEVISTEEMLAACQGLFPDCDGAIGAAAPCDYRPRKMALQKIAKTGEPLELELVETPDVVATLGRMKRPGQWLVGFALETEDHRFRAITKLEKKSCELMVLNGPEAMNSLTNCVEVLDRQGMVVESLSGPKEVVAVGIIRTIERLLLSSLPPEGRVSTAP